MWIRLYLASCTALLHAGRKVKWKICFHIILQYTAILSHYIQKNLQKMNLGLITLIFQNMVGFAEGLQWIYCARNRHNTKDQSDNQYCYPVLKAKMVGCLIPAHIRSSTVDVSATGFAPLHTLRHHPSDRITLMSHLQETPSLAAWVQVRWQAASPLNEWMNELKACSPTLVASVCNNYKVWQHEWGNSVDWTLWYTEGVHVRGLEKTTQP